MNLKGFLAIEDDDRPYTTRFDAEVEVPEFFQGDLVRSTLSHTDHNVDQGVVVEVIPRVEYLYRVRFEHDDPDNEPTKFYGGVLAKIEPYDVQEAAHHLVDDVLAALGRVPEEYRSDVTHEFAQELTSRGSGA